MRKQIQALFPTLEPLLADGDLDLDIAWRRTGFFGTGYETVGHKPAARILPTPFWERFRGGPSARLHIGPDRVVPVQVLSGRAADIFEPNLAAKIPIGVGGTCGSIGSDDHLITIRRAASQGQLKIDDRRYKLRPKGPRVTLWLESQVVAQYAPAWKDGDSAARIVARTGATSEFTADEALMISALLLLTAPVSVDRSMES
jgi:hypothetical protein